MKPEPTEDLQILRRRVNYRGKKKLGRPARRGFRNKEDYSREMILGGFRFSLQSYYRRLKKSKPVDVSSSIPERINWLENPDIGKTTKKTKADYVRGVRDGFVIAHVCIEKIFRRVKPSVNVTEDIVSQFKAVNDAHFDWEKEIASSFLEIFPNDLVRKARQKFSKSKFSMKDVNRLHRFVQEYVGILYFDEAAKQMNLSPPQLSKLLLYCKKMKRPIAVGYPEGKKILIARP